MIDLGMPALSVNTLALLILLVLLGEVKARSSRFLLIDQRLFAAMLFTNIAMLVLDTGTWLLDGRMFPGARTLNMVVTASYYALDPLMAFLYLYYCDVKISVPKARRLKLLPLYLAPFAVNLVLTLLSIRGGYLFRIGADNHYSRGSLLVLSFILSSMLMAVAFISVTLYLLAKRKAHAGSTMQINPHGVHSLLVFTLPPLVGVVVQIWVNQVTIVWISTVISLLITFIHLQNVEITTDVLTGIFNRRQTESYLQSLMQPSGKERPFALIVMDLNHFKQVNDRYGHLMGDNALRAMAEVLHDVCRKDEFYSRYGGDEFVVITHTVDEPYIYDLIKRLNESLAVYCTLNALPVSLTLCAGHAVCDADIESPDALFALADAQLYAQKAALRRRTTDQ